MTLRHILALLWTFGIVVACTVPGSSLPSLTFWEVDKLAHFVLFAGLGWCWMWALELPLARRTWVVLVAGVAFAWGTEVYQGILPWERTPDVYDFAANALGLVASVLLYRHLNPHRPEENMTEPVQ